MKRSELFFSAILVPIDYIMIIITAWFTFWLRFQEFTGIRPLAYTLEIQIYMKWVLVFSPIFLIIFAFLGLYQIKTTTRFWKEIIKVGIGVAAGLGILIFMFFINREIFASRFFIGVGGISGTIAIVFGRTVVRIIQNYYSVNFKSGLHKLIIIGNNKIAYKLENSIKNNPETGYKVIGRYKDISIQKLKNLYKQKGIEELIVTDTSRPVEKAEELLNFSDCHKLTYKFIPSSFQTRLGKFSMDTFLDFPIIEVQKTPLEGWGRIIKRIVDLFGAIVGIIIFGPFMIASIIAIKLTSPGPVFADIPPRAGQHGKAFKCLKFRSMYTGAHKDQKKFKSDRKGIFKLKNDPRITPVGKILRKSSLDETPQFFNIIRGEMSLVGPRPHFLNEYNLNQQKKLLILKPGITGISQVSGRSDNSLEEEIKLDIFYLENWSLLLDFIIITKTFLIFFQFRND